MLRIFISALLVYGAGWFMGKVRGLEWFSEFLQWTAVLSIVLMFIFYIVDKLKNNRKNKELKKL